MTDDSLEPGEEGPLKELYLLVRPEEKYAVERALQSVVGPIYSSFTGLGRGTSGGVSYADGKRRPWWSLKRERHLSIFLPKVIFYLVVAAADADEVVSAVTHALRAEGGPTDCGRGFGVVMPMEGDSPIELGHRVGSLGARS
jgi:nitrogen regulatory protein PII